MAFGLVGFWRVWLGGVRWGFWKVGAGLVWGVRGVGWRNGFPVGLYPQNTASPCYQKDILLRIACKSKQQGVLKKRQALGVPRASIWVMGSMTSKLQFLLGEEKAKTAAGSLSCEDVDWNNSVWRSFWDIYPSVLSARIGKEQKRVVQLLGCHAHAISLRRDCLPD